MKVDFYHLTASPIERVLPRITERVLAGGGRLLIVSADAAQRAMLDRHLWTYKPDSFLPHAQAGGEKDAGQPILLSQNAAPDNAARNIALADGAWRDEALGFDRAFHFFDEARIEEARAAWRALADSEGADREGTDRGGLERRYWKQGETGGWEHLA